MTNKLVEICATKREEVATRRASITVADLHDRALHQTPPRGFRQALDRNCRDSRRAPAPRPRVSPELGTVARPPRA